jgi:hypothetical protein
MRSNELALGCVAALVLGVGSVSLNACSSSPEPAVPATSEDVPNDSWIAGDDPDEGGDAGFDPCVELEQCPGDDQDAGVEEDAGVETDAGVDAGADAATPAPPPGYVVGARMLVKVYTWFRSGPSADEPVVESVAPQGGVKDSTHPGQPLGMIPPGQEVELVDPIRSGSFYKVRYDGKVGWVNRYKILLIDTDAHPVDFAMREEVRNALFKRQAQNGTFNRDGPGHSSNCGPTSLAMAVRIWGKEKPGLSIEQSIHVARNKAKPGSGDLDSVSQSELATGGDALGLSIKKLGSGVTATETLDWIDTQLDQKRVVTLAGMTGSDLQCCKDPTADHQYCSGGDTEYQQAIIAAQNYPYNFDCFHSIAVIGRTNAGKYVVADPMSRAGMVPMTKSALKDFVSRWRSGANAFYLPGGS